MTGRWGSRVRDRLMAFAFAVVFLIVALTLLTIETHHVLGENRVGERLVDTRAELAALQIADAWDDAREIDRICAVLAARPSIRAVQILDVDGNVAGEAGVGLHEKLRGTRFESPGVHTLEASHSQVVTRIIRRRDDSPLGSILLFADPHQASGHLSISKSLFLAFVAALLCAILGTWVFTRYLSTPIRELSRAAQQVQSGNFDVSVPVRSRDEMAELAVAFNRMVEELKRNTISRAELEREIGERKRAFEHIKQLKDKAEEAARIKSEFLANMSHEIRTPLNAIIGMSKLSLEPGIDSREQLENVSVIHASAESLLAIINDILDFSKIEAGKLELDPAPTTLDEVLTATLRPLAPQAHEKGLELIADAGFDLPQTIVVDSTRLRQVLINLVSNAIKFTNEGSVTLRTSVRKRRGDALTLRFEVEDTGIGIAKERQQKIFAPFRQADGSTTRQFGGTGLGLSISAQLLELMETRLELDSEPDRGSRFYFDVEVTGSAAPDYEAYAEPIRGQTIWVFDRDPSCRRQIERDLAAFGATVVVESDPARIEAMLSDKDDPDIALIDIDLVDAEGKLVIEQLTDIAGKWRAPTIALRRTTSGSQRRRRKQAEVSITQSLTKPILSRDLLFACVEALTRRSGAGRAPVAPEIKEPAQGSDPQVSAAPTGKSKSTFVRKSSGHVLEILLAEDNPVNQKLATRILERRGHHVHLASNGIEALEAHEKCRFDVVLMDMQMPELSGLEACREIRIREANGVPRTPIVALTANVLTEDRRACREAGMDGYVGKPIDVEELFAEIARVIGFEVQA